MMWYRFADISYEGSADYRFVIVEADSKQTAEEILAEGRSYKMSEHKTLEEALECVTGAHSLRKYAEVVDLRIITR